MLTGYIEYPGTIYPYGVNKLPKDLISEGELIIKVFKRASDYYDGERFKIKIMS